MHRAGIPLFLCFIGYIPSLFYERDPYTVPLSTQKYKPHLKGRSAQFLAILLCPRSYLTRSYGTAAWRYLQVNQSCWQASLGADKQQASDPGFSKGPPFPSVSVTMPILRAFSFDYSPVLRLMGKILPSFGSTSQLWSWLKLSRLLWTAIAEHTGLNFPAHLEKELTDVTSTEDWHLFLKMH